MHSCASCSKISWLEPLTAWTILTVLDLLGIVFFWRYDVLNVNSYVPWTCSWTIAVRPFKTFKARLLTFPHLRRLLLTRTLVFWVVFGFLFKFCSQNPLKSVTDVNNNAQTQSSTLVVTWEVEMTQQEAAGSARRRSSGAVEKRRPR